MLLYLTGAEASLIDSNGNSPQPIPSNSLGGFVSSTLVPNNAINELFDLISKMTLNEGSIEVIGICLNNTIDDYSTTKIKILTEDGNIGKYKICTAVIDESDISMEKINTRYDLPQYGDFIDVEVYKACADINILTCGSVGEEFTILPFGIAGEVLENTYEGIYNALKKAFSPLKNSYEVKRIDNTHLRIQRIDDTIETFTCELVTTDNLTLEFSDDFKNKKNNVSTLISDVFKKNDKIGIWIMREIEKNDPISFGEMINNYDIGKNLDLIENIELIIEYEK